MLGRRAQIESVRGTEVSVRAGAQWGQGWVPSATTTPRPLSWGRRRSTVEAWIHSSTFTTINIFTFGMEKKMKTVSLRFWIPFLFFPKINASQGSLSMVCAYPGSLFPVSITKWNKYICGLQRTSFCLNHFPWNLKKKKKVTFASISVTPPTLTRQLMTSTWWPCYKGHCEMTKLTLCEIKPSGGLDLAKTLANKGGRRPGNRTDHKHMLCWLKGSYRKDPITVFSAAPWPQPSNRKVKGNFDKLKYHYH